MAIIFVTTSLWIPINLIPSLDPPDFHFGPENCQKCPKISFSSKMATEGQWFGLKLILIGSISGYCISNDFSMNSNKFSRLTGPHGHSFRAQKCLKIPKNQYFPSKIAGQVQWFGLKTILFDSVIGSYIPKDLSMNSNKFSPLTGSSGPSFRARKCLKMPKNQYFPFKTRGWRSMIRIKADPWPTQEFLSRPWPILFDSISGYY